MAPCAAGRRNVAGNQRAKITVSIADGDDLLRSLQELAEPFFNGLGRDVVPGVQNDQVLDPAG